MKYAIVSLVPEMPMSALREYAAAQTRQIAEDFADLWQSGPLAVEAFSSVADAGREWSPIVVYRDADQPGELGDHETTPDGRPVGRVFAGPILANGGDILRGPGAITTTLSHEALEMDGDPYINGWFDTPDGDEEAAEVGDRVEADWYEIDRVALSNFLGPRAFSLIGPGPYDRLGNLKNAWDMTPGGYKNRRQGGPAGQITQVFGEQMPEWKRDLKRKSQRFARRAALSRRSAMGSPSPVMRAAAYSREQEHAAVMREYAAGRDAKWQTRAKPSAAAIPVGVAVSWWTCATAIPVGVAVSWWTCVTCHARNTEALTFGGHCPRCGSAR